MQKFQANLYETGLTVHLIGHPKSGVISSIELSPFEPRYKVDFFDGSTSGWYIESLLAPDYHDELVVGDTASDARGSGARFNSGKPALDMIPLHLLEGAARVFHGVTTREVKPYPKWNWAKGMPWSVPLGCVKRHIGAWERGEDKDPETGESHLDHIICNLLMLKHYEDAFIEGDDRPKQFFKKGGVNAKA